MILGYYFITVPKVVSYLKSRRPLKGKYQDKV